LDGSHFRMHEGARAEPVLVAWGITSEGPAVFVGLDSGASKSTGAWRASRPPTGTLPCPSPIVNLILGYPTVN
jgi:hypothetical protein